MTNLIFIFIALSLLFGFFVLVNYEARRGTRFCVRYRNQLDNVIERIEFIIENVNLSEFLFDEIRHLAGRIGHNAVRFSLIVVRSIERLLTGLVRHMRNHPDVDAAPRETAREFVKTLSDFKGNLKAKHPEISDTREN